MTENDKNRVHYLLNCCDVNGRIDINSADMTLILEYHRELGKADKRKKLLDEIFVLSEAHSVDIPVVYGDGTQCVEKYISLEELHLIMTEMKGEPT